MPRGITFDLLDVDSESLALHRLYCIEVTSFIGCVTRTNLIQNEASHLQYHLIHFAFAKEIKTL